MGNTQYTDELKRSAREEREILEKKIRDKEKEWSEFLARETSKNLRRQEELKTELYCRTNELNSLKTEIEREREEEVLFKREELSKLKPGDSFDFPPDDITFPNKYNIGLFGTTGIGKSSLINSLKFAFNGELTELTREQTSSKLFHGGNTVRRLDVPVTKYLTFIDNRGVGAEDLENINAGEEIISQLEGRAGYGSQVDWRNSDGAKGLKARAKNRIYCTILVFDPRNPTAVFSVLPKLVAQIFKWQGRYPIGVFTHVDKATPEQLENMKLVTNAAGIVDTFEVANITEERTKLGKDHQVALLKLMRLCIKQGDQVFKLRENIEREEAENREIAKENERKVKEEEENARKKNKWKWKKK